MSGIDFPSSPSLNQQHTEFGNVWKWNGSAWRKISRSLEQGAQGDPGVPGAQGVLG